MINIVDAKNKFLHKHLYKHLTILGLISCLFILLYIINTPFFISLSKLAMSTMALYLMINAFSTRHITQNAFLSYISISYGAINVLQCLQSILPQLLEKPINNYFLAMATYHIGRLSFAVSLIILTYTYVKKTHQLESISYILMGILALSTVILIPLLTTSTFANFVTGYSIASLIFNLCINLFMPFALIFSVVMIYPIHHKIPYTHKVIMIVFLVLCSISEVATLIYFTPLATPRIIPYLFKISTLYLLIIGQIDCCILRPFSELYLKNELTEKNAEDTTQELYRYSVYTQQLENNLKTRTSHYERILSLFPEPFLLCTDDKILDANQAALNLFHSFNKHNLAGNSLFSYLNLDYSALEAYNHLSTTPGKLLKGEARLTTLKEEVYDVEYLFTTTYLHESINIVCILRNITEKKQIVAAEKALEEQNLKLTYFSNISHDIKMPINIIYSALQMQSHATNLSECLHYTEMMQTNSLKLLKLINNILDITKIDNNMLQFSSQVFNLVDAVETLCEVSYYYMQEKNITYIFDTDVDEKFVHTDPAAFERIIFNLLSNAIKYTAPGGILLINIVNLDDHIQIDIQDNGIGIAPGKVDYIFERFTSFEQGPSSKEHSCGIGLSIVRDLVHLMSGTITCQSTLGEGTTFNIILPTPTLGEVLIDYPYQSTYTSHNIKIEFCDI